MKRLFYLVLSLAIVSTALPTLRAEDPGFKRQEDVIYGRKFGVALTMDVITPAKQNGAAIIHCVSGGWFSSHDGIAGIVNGDREYLKRGYTIFAVVHGSQPKFTIPEILQDMHRAVRFIRTHASDYHIDPDRIGITGGSAGGHLSLMMGTTGKDGDPNAKDPVDRASSKVQAVACFFPPTDFFNYGKPGEDALGRGVLAAFKAPFDFHVFDNKTHAYVPITDEEERHRIGKEISPNEQVTSHSAPTLIIHGDVDKLVPMQQSELIVARLRAAGVPAELIVKKGGNHGWGHMENDVPKLADWFDKYLAPKK